MKPINLHYRLNFTMTNELSAELEECLLEVDSDRLDDSFFFPLYFKTTNSLLEQLMDQILKDLNEKAN